ncbi:MAG TPA: SCO family protein [Kofleriaceae bacterium]|nr:SCO family protein [Kofleriaceae bacterium]
MRRLALVVVVALAHPAAADNARLAVGLDEHVGAQLPRDLVFTASTGKRVALGDLFDGKRPVLLVLAYAHCTMLCPVVLHGAAEAIRATPLVPGRDYLPVVVSLDPRETPDEGARRQDGLLADIGRVNDRAAWPYLVGDDASVHALADVLGFRYAWDEHTQQYAHPVVIFVITPDGKIAEYLRGVRFDDLGPALARAANGQSSETAAHDLLTCFHFDPSLRRYGAKIALFFRLGAGLVLVTLCAIVIALIRWERRRRRS